MNNNLLKVDLMLLAVILGMVSGMVMVWAVTQVYKKQLEMRQRRANIRRLLNGILEEKRCK